MPTRSRVGDYSTSSLRSSSSWTICALSSNIFSSDMATLLINSWKPYCMLNFATSFLAVYLPSANSPSLSRPANTLYRHNLTATLEAAIRSTTARYDPPDIIRRLDARMLEYSHGEIGWDVFTLEYKIDAPVDTIIDPKSMESYLKIFSWLWRLKRVEGALTQLWSNICGGAKAFLQGGEREGGGGVKGGGDQNPVARVEMIHLVKELQGFWQLRGIECSGKELMDFTK